MPVIRAQISSVVKFQEARKGADSPLSHQYAALPLPVGRAP